MYIYIYIYMICVCIYIYNTYVYIYIYIYIIILYIIGLWSYHVGVIPVLQSCFVHIPQVSPNFGTSKCSDYRLSRGNPAVLFATAWENGSGTCLETPGIQLVWWIWWFPSLLRNSYSPIWSIFSCLVRTMIFPPGIATLRHSNWDASRLSVPGSCHFQVTSHFDSFANYSLS